MYLYTCIIFHAINNMLELLISKHLTATHRQRIVQNARIDHAYNDSDFKLYFKPYLYAAYFTGNLFSQNRSKIF